MPRKKKSKLTSKKGRNYRGEDVKKIKQANANGKSIFLNITPIRLMSGTNYRLRNAKYYNTI